jgi:hypothetical protein
MSTLFSTPTLMPSYFALYQYGGSVYLLAHSRPSERSDNEVLIAFSVERRSFYIYGAVAANRGIACERSVHHNSTRIIVGDL